MLCCWLVNNYIGGFPSLFLRFALKTVITKGNKRSLIINLNHSIIKRQCSNTLRKNLRVLILKPAKQVRIQYSRNSNPLDHAYDALRVCLHVFIQATHTKVQCCSICSAFKTNLKRQTFNSSKYSEHTRRAKRYNWTVLMKQLINQSPQWSTLCTCIHSTYHSTGWIWRPFDKDVA